MKLRVKRQSGNKVYLARSRNILNMKAAEASNSRPTMKFVAPSVAITLVLSITRCFVSAEEPATTSLPPLDTVLKQIAARADTEDAGNEAFKQHYFYVRTKVSEYRNSSGDLKKRETKAGTNNPALMVPLLRPQSSVTNRSPDKPKQGDEPVSDTHSNVKGKALDRKDFSLNQDLLGRFDFKLIGREPLNGRSALIVDFAPANKKLPVHNLKDKFINRAAGRVWVDETDYAVVKVDLHLTSQVNVWGGLVGSVWVFHYSFDRERTPEGWWYTRYVNWHLEGREVVVRRTVDYHEELAQLRKIASGPTAAN